MLLAICLGVVIMFVAADMLLPLSTSWPLYAVLGLFAPVVAWMISRPWLRLAVDGARRELVITRAGLLMRAERVRLPLAGIARVVVVERETSDDNLYHVEIVGSDGRARRITLQQIASRQKCDAIAAQVRAQLIAAGASLS